MSYNEIQAEIPRVCCRWPDSQLKLSGLEIVPSCMNCWGVSWERTTETVNLNPAKNLVLGNFGNKMHLKDGVLRNLRTNISWLQEDQFSGTLALQT